MEVGKGQRAERRELVDVSVSASFLLGLDGTLEFGEDGFEGRDDGFEAFDFGTHAQQSLFEVEVERQ